MYCFFFNDTATTEIYTLSLHDALPISSARRLSSSRACPVQVSTAIAAASCAGSSSAAGADAASASPARTSRSEEHTSELQSLQYLVCRLLLEKKKKQTECNLS